MVATWLLELYMDQINRALLEEPPSAPGDTAESAPAAEPMPPVAQENGTAAGKPVV